MPVTGNAVFDSKIEGLAVAFGLNHIVMDTGPQNANGPSLFADQTALERGIPAITTETGKSGSNAPYWVGLAERGIWNVLRHLDMISEDEVINTGITWLSDYKVITSPRSGIFSAYQRRLFCGRKRSAGCAHGLLWERIVNDTSTFCRSGELRH